MSHEACGHGDENRTAHNRGFAVSSRHFGKTRGDVPPATSLVEMVRVALWRMRRDGPTVTSVGLLEWLTTGPSFSMVGQGPEGMERPNAIHRQ